MDSICTVILAAGKGTRLKTSFPKPLAPVLGKTLVDFVIASVQSSFKNSKFCVVTGHAKETVQEHIKNQSYYKDESFEFVDQTEQLGTGHALKIAIEGSDNAKASEYTLVVCADTPCLSSSLFDSLKNNSDDHEAIVISFQPENPFGYGRVFFDGEGRVQIVEQKDAKEEQRKHNEVNSGIYLFKTSFLKANLAKLNTNNASNEFYLTDLFNFTTNAASRLIENPAQFLGVNDLIQLNEAEVYLREQKLKELMLAGVVIKDTKTTVIEEDVLVGQDSVIHRNVEISGNSRIGNGVQIEQGAIIRNSTIAAGAIIKANSYIDESIIGENVKIGPMAQLRPGSVVKKGSKIGNFVELKKAVLEENVSVSHLSYVGDAEIGSGANLGCGFITCNYDGAKKHLTKIGKNTFIGSDSQMVAPINIGDNCYVASGSTINQDMADGSFAIARTRQVIKEGLAKRFLKKKS